ncbi:ATP-grasp domain-containing protein [Helicobacter sp. 11S02596-1]|uniref:ATP-grasp domain-containing protein n=1 Tax=Helicobacter sp. 11S02596-1 TaxID=1476194 RepID=UPI000BA60FA4|nr:ATP-grasp domain-containing protein [Helicobacter sp. 11S02596-1]PAF45167.1 hypothetical protein BJI48_00960 [Helicobacter sp. 11S02596-1]
MKKLLIAGGKFSDIPTIKSAQKLGYHVITSGNNPSDLGHLHADEVALEDYADKEAMLKLAKSLDIDLLIPSCDDVSALTCAYIAQHLAVGHFDSFATAEILHHKDRYREFAKQHQIDTPFALGFEDLQSASAGIKAHFKDQKIIIKPVDNAAGKGISTLEPHANDEQIKDVVQKAFEASLAKRIVVEEFITGSKHGFSTILKDQKVIFYFYDNEQYHYNPYAVSGTTTSSFFTPQMIQKLIKDIEKIACLLHLADGIFHTQTIIKPLGNGKFQPIIIEACRRGGGDLYMQFVSIACNLDYARLVIEAISGAPITPLKPNHRKFFARQCVMSKQTGILEAIVFENAIQENLIDSLMWHKKGDEIADTRLYKAGIVFLEFASQQEMQEKINHLDKYIAFRFTNGGGA